LDVLEKGQASSYYRFFDIDWDHPYQDLKGRLLAPFLGKFYAESLENGEIKLELDEKGLSIRYYNWRFPLSRDSYAGFFPNGPDEQSVARFNGTAGKPETFNELDQLISSQLYRLSFWKVASEEINYRRFFNINELICLRVEDEAVFEATHALIFRLIKEEKFDGLRIDHVDGLYDPAGYLKRLRQKVGDIYLLVEKILAEGEKLPEDWPVQGTTGYDFLNQINALFCRKEGARQFAKIYYKFAGQPLSYDQLLADKKRLIIGRHMAGNIDNLARQMKGISSGDRYGRDITLYGLRRALVEVMVYFPVYRTYVNQDNLSAQDRSNIMAAVTEARAKNPALCYEIDFIERFLLREYKQGEGPADFIMKFQQYTAPLMAKGFEDTFLYIYNKFISLNEVGGDPNRFGLSVKDFHKFITQRFIASPHGLNATSTHDTKRGEDVRSRINVLSELAGEWKNNLKVWSRLNKAKKTIKAGNYAPDTNDEYFIYQTMLGALPFQEGDYPAFKQRLKDYVVKAVREAKVHTAWLKPDTEYEEACLKFVDEIMKQEDNRFWPDFLAWQKKIVFYGMFNSLSQLLLKIALPGVPDFYQGTELWDLSLVDPDNRRPIDFAARKDVLSLIKSAEDDDLPALMKELLKTKSDGRIKLFLMYRLLKARKAQEEIFARGRYLPLRVEGHFKDHVIAFARRLKSRWLVAVAPRFLTSLVEVGRDPLAEEVWQDAAVVLPSAAPDSWRDTISNEEIKVAGQKLRLGAALKDFPAALLYGEK
ncbi:MAG: malto-oligosyltrehalose synthase, partial [Candidatus Margulisbacteria bacterium]|nr:malto-oligosyltrehalose synthase [Candidatus Margulisiibacteriota bacterium]